MAVGLRSPGLLAPSSRSLPPLPTTSCSVKQLASTRPARGLPLLLLAFFFFFFYLMLKSHPCWVMSLLINT